MPLTRSNSRNIIDVFTGLMPAWVILFAILAYMKPGTFIPLKRFMNIFFAVTMLGIGVTLKLEDFRNILNRPGMVLTGVAAQFTIMPLSAFFISRVMGLPPMISLGLVLAGSAPGAMASNVICYVAGADVAYSVSLTSVSTLLTPVVTPALVYLLAGSMLKVDFFIMFIGLIKMVVGPLIAGIAIRHYFNNAIEGVVRVFPAISVSFIVFICALVIALNRARISDITFSVLLAAVFLNLNGLFMGYGLAKALGFGVLQRRTLSIEIGMQNAGLGTILALNYFGPQAAIPTAAFVFICIFSASLAAEFWKNMKTKF